MKDYRLAETESHFADIIWREEPVPSGELVKICQRELNWKKSTTYTMLKRLCDKEIFQNLNSIVTSRLSRKEFIQYQSHQFVEDTFEGSLPKFLASFMEKKSLSKKQLDEIQALIDSHKEV